MEEKTTRISFGQKNTLREVEEFLRSDEEGDASGRTLLDNLRCLPLGLSLTKAVSGPVLAEVGDLFSWFNRTLCNGGRMLRTSRRV